MRVAAAGFLAIVTALQTPQPDVVKVIAGRAEIRSEPSARAPVLSQVREGAYLILIKEDNAWFQVQVPSTRGLRALGYVQKTEAVKVKPAEAAAAIEAMRRPPAKPPGDSIAIGVDVTPKTIWLKAQATKAFPIAGTVSTVAAAAASASVVQVLGAAGTGVDPGTVSLPPGVNDATWIWVTQANKVAPVLSTRRPSFYVSYGEVPGLNYREWAPYVVRLAPAGEWRVISALAGPALARNHSQPDWEIRRTIVQNELPGDVTGLADGMVRLSLKAPLTPGDHAVVIRPAFHRRAYSGRAILGDEGPGVAFGAVWVFAVK